MSSSAPAKKGSRLFPSEVMSPPMPAYALRAGEGAHLADSAPGNRQGRRSPRPDRLHSGAGTSLGRRRTPSGAISTPLSQASIGLPDAMDYALGHGIDEAPHAPDHG